MKTSIKILVAAMAISSVGFVGCKKGEGDPFLSLASRKARLAGEWKVSAGEGKDTDASGTATWTYDGAIQTTVNTPGGTTTDKFTITYEFEKDGTYKTVYTDNNSAAVTYTYTGTWNWSGGVGDMKNKSQVVLTQLTFASGSITQSWTGSDAPTSVMDVYQLKGKEVIFKGTGTTTSVSGNTTSDFSWTLTPQ